MRVIEELYIKKIIKDAEVGIEIEIEGDNLPRDLDRPHKHWNMVHDGSLRGEAVEFVLRRPCTREDVPTRLVSFKRLLKDTVVHESGRAGIHIHVNCQQLEMREVIQFITLYLIFENILVEWCGDGRVGNLFCLRSDDAGHLLQVIRMAVKRNQWEYFDTDDIRYASINVKALCTYGSLEFRAMRSTSDTEVIQNWINILLKIKDAALEFNAPHEIVERLSFESTQGFFDRVLGGMGPVYNHQAMMDGVRNAQYVAYTRTEWSAPQPKAEEEEIEPGAFKYFAHKVKKPPLGKLDPLKQWANAKPLDIDAVLRAHGPGAMPPAPPEEDEAEEGHEYEEEEGEDDF